jgi:hypothetical protein
MSVIDGIVKALALVKPQLHLNKNKKLNEFPKARI